MLINFVYILIFYILFLLNINSYKKYIRGNYEKIYVRWFIVYAISDIYYAN